MVSIRRWCLSVVAVAPVLFFGGHATASNAEIMSDEQADLLAIASIPQVTHRDLCADPGPGFMRCFAKVVTQPDGQVAHFANPQGFGPTDLRSAYNLPASGGNGKWVAIVDANDAPNAEADLGKYRSQYGLPPCTTANGCFKKVNQDGVQGNYPQADSGWAGEIALDLDMVSAACPDCKILLVEANSATTDDLGTSVNTAAQLGAVAISNSYGGGEDSSVSSVSAQYYKHPGILVTVSSGDNGYGAQFPASSEFVLAVGGTRLTKSSSTRGWAETAWTSGGSGCSKYITKPSWQTDTKCTKRTVADVASVGDPATGVAVYDGGWQVVGGTSASAPFVAAAFTLLGLNTVDGSFPYQHTTSFYDVTSGSNGSCSGTYLCSAGTGYDGPTGVGTPNGGLLGGTGPVVDAGVPPVDASVPPHDSGVPAQDASTGGGGSDAGVTNDTDASTGGGGGGGGGGGNGGSGGGGYSTSDAGAKTDAGHSSGTTNNADPMDTSGSSPSGCGCEVLGASAPISGAGSTALLAGAIALLVSRRRRRD